MLYTVEKANFERMVKAAVKSRKERLEDKHNLNIFMRPEFVQAFQGCMSFSSKVIWVSSYLLRWKWKSFSADEVLVKEEENEGWIGRGQARGGSPERRPPDLPLRIQAN
jgi:hypothetical protein